MKMTQTRQSCLNPEWDETKEFRINRADVAGCSVQVQIWAQDYGDEKKVKGLKGVGR